MTENCGRLIKNLEKDGLIVSEGKEFIINNPIGFSEICKRQILLIGCLNDIYENIEDLLRLEWNMYQLI